MLIGLKYAKLIILQNLALNKGTWSRFALMLFKLREIWFGKLILRKIHVVVVVVVLLYGLVWTRLQHSKNIQSCIASQWKSNTDNKTLLLLKWNLHSIIHRKYKTHCKNISRTLVIFNIHKWPTRALCWRGPQFWNIFICWRLKNI